MRDFGKVSTELWQSVRFRSMQDNRDAQLLYVYFHTNTHANSIGCYRLPRGYIMADMDLDDRAMDRAMDRCIDSGLIAYHEPENMLFIDKFLEKSPITNKKHAIGAVKAALRLPDCEPKLLIIKELLDDPYVKDLTEFETLKEFYDRAMDTPTDTPMHTERQRQRQRQRQRGRECERGREKSQAEADDKSDAEPDNNIETVFEHYNTTADTMPCWTKARDRTDKRVKAIRARIRDRFKTPQALCAYITEASETGFLSRDDHDTWNCSLDFLLKPETIRKVSEGQYGQAKPTAKTHRSHADSERDIWSWRLQQWHKAGVWEDRWGPPPDHEMSHVPRDLLKETRH